MFDTTSLKEQYSLGDRKFSQADLERADLENIFLSRVEMIKANLNYAHL